MYKRLNYMDDSVVLHSLRHAFQDRFIDDNLKHTHDKSLQRVIEDMIYLSGNLSESLTHKEVNHINNYDSTYNIKLTVKLVRLIKNIQQDFMHRPSKIGNNVCRLLNDKLTNIISYSNIEHDISMAYLLKIIIKNMLVKGEYRIHHKLHTYTWMDKLFAFCYICGHMQYIDAATLRMNRTIYAFRRNVDLISSLNHVRHLIERKTLLEIINDSLSD